MKIPVRYQFVTGTFLLSLLLYIDRACISVAKGPIATSLSLSDRQMGWVMSVFALLRYYPTRFKKKPDHIRVYCRRKSGVSKLLPLKTIN